MNPTTASNAYACALDGTITALTPKACYSYVADVANTASASINYNSLGAKTIVKVQGGITTPLVANDIRAGAIVTTCYDGTNMQCQNCTGNAPSGTASNVTDGDKGAITVTGGVWALDPIDLSTVSLTGTLAQFNTAVSDANLVPDSRTLTPSAPLAGGGDLSANRTVTCPTCTTNAAALTANQLVLGGGAQASQALGSLGTATTVLHGNAAGAPTFNAVSLTADVSGDLPYANLTPATAASLLLGRGSASAGDWQELTLGTNLSITGTMLNASRGGGGVTTDTAQRAAFYNSTTTIDGATALTFSATGDTLNTRADRITTVSTTRTLDTTDGPTVACTGGASDITLTLPVGATTTQRAWTIVKVDSGVGKCLLKGNGTDTIHGSTGTLALDTQWERADLALANSGSPANWTASLGVLTVDLASQVTGVLPVANVDTKLRTRTCMILAGTDNAAAVLANADLGPQLHQCRVDVAMTVQEIAVYADAGTPNVIVHRRSGVTNTALLSSALATAAAGAVACAKTGATTSLDGTTTCAATLQNTTVAAGDTIGLTSGTAGGVAKRMTIAVTMTTN